jgi:hypothetical protein
MEAEYGSAHLTFMERVLESGPIGIAGLAVVLFAFVFLACSVYLCQTRKQFLTAVAGAIVIGLGGYFAYDRTYIMLNLSMRDADSVRADCMALLQRRNLRAPGYTGDLHLSGKTLPESFVRLGANNATVTSTYVGISFISDWNGGEYGFLFATQQADSNSEWPRDVRPTWYRGFYQFRVWGE